MATVFHLNPLPARSGLARQTDHRAGPAPRSGGAERAPPPGQTCYPCSPGQRRFWVLDQLDPHNPALNVAVRWRLEGAVSHAHLESAFRLIIERHQVLRAWFSRMDGEPVQVVEPQVSFHIPLIDLSSLPQADAAAEAERIARLEARASFDLEAAPLIRVTHLRVRETISMLLVTAHHIVCDGWSVGVLAREMGQICAALHRGAPPQLPPLAIAYTEYARRQLLNLESPRMRAEMQYWTGLLHGVRQFEVLTDRPRPPVQTANGNILSVLLDRSLTNALAELSRRQGCTMFMTSLAAFLVLLHRYTGETDIAIGTQFAGREEVELEELVGLFINTLLLRNDLSGNPAFAELLERVRDTVTDAYENQHVPLERLIEILRPKRDPSRNALFSINFIFQRSFIHNEDYGGFRLVDLPSCPAGAMYDLNVFMVERPEGWRASCEYNTDLFEAQTVLRLLGHFQNLLRAVTLDPAVPISALPLLGEVERAELVEAGNRTAAAYPDSMSLPALFDAQVARTPEATALVCGRTQLSYRELQQSADRLAQHLRRYGAARGERVAVCLERSPELVIALLGILKAGSAYIPLDPAYPVDRIAYVLDNARPAALVTRSGLRNRLPESAAELLLLDAEAAQIEAQPPAPLAPPEPEDLAYLIYTSGSTGKPKGVQIQHRALTNLLWAMRERPGLSAADTLLSVTTISFDIAALELFLPLTCGARLVLAQEHEALDGRLLLQLMQRYGVSLLQATPATWQLLLEAGWKQGAGLKVLCGGEALPRKLATALLERGGELWNMYGPTETTIWSSALKVEAGEGAVPLGPPIANTQFYVLDRQRQLVPLGVPGELYIGGDGVALGYWGLAEVTHERFVPDPFRAAAGARMYRTGDIVRRRPDGCFDYLGRVDFQVKLRGFRIELGEIEAVLQRHPQVSEAVAVVGQDPAGEPALRAYVACKALDAGQRSALVAALRLELGKSLPVYMHPAAIVPMESLPHTPNGKIDRRALPPLPAQELKSGSAPAAPLNATEARLAAIWASVLGLEEVDRSTDFIDLGGHSLLAARLLARIETEFGHKISLAALFKAPTIAAQARLLTQEDVREYDFRQIIRLQPNGSRPPLIAINNTSVHYYNLSRRLGADQPLTALQLFDPSLQRRELPGSFEGIAAEYVQLIREFQPAGPYKLMGWCVGGALAFEVARQLNEQGQEVSMLTVFDAWAPGYLRRLPPLRARLADYSYRWQLIVADWVRVVASRRGGVREFLAHRTLFKKLRRWLGQHDAVPLLPPVQGEQLSDESYDQWLLGYLGEAVRRYEPKHYRGKVTLICSLREPRGLFLHHDMGWGSLCDEVEVATVDGDHFTMFQDPGVTQMASYLSAVLERSAVPPLLPGVPG